MADLVFNSLENSYGNGGAIAADTAKGGLSGAGTGAAIGTGILPGVGTAVGAAAGFLIGGVTSFFKSKKANDDKDAAQVEADKLAFEAKQDKYDNDIIASRTGAFNEVVNAPVNPIEMNLAYGGFIGDNGVGEINPTDVTEINAGGSHENNPLGGVPQGTGANGKVNKVEQGEVKIKTGKGESYVFSDRLIFY